MRKVEGKGTSKIKSLRILVRDLSYALDDLRVDFL